MDTADHMRAVCKYWQDRTAWKKKSQSQILGIGIAVEMAEGSADWLQATRIPFDSSVRMYLFELKDKRN